MHAIDIIRSVDEVGCVQLVLALDAREALLVVDRVLGNLLLGLKHKAVASEWNG